MHNELKQVKSQINQLNTVRHKKVQSHEDPDQIQVISTEELSAQPDFRKESPGCPVGPAEAASKKKLPVHSLVTAQPAARKKPTACPVPDTSSRKAQESFRRRQCLTSCRLSTA